MKKVLVVQPLHTKAIELLESRADISYEVLTDFSEENLLKHVADADAITVRDAPLSQTVLSKAPALRIVSRHGVGYDNIPVDYCSERNIPVTVVGPVNAVSVAEHTLFLLLAVARVGIYLDSAVREDRFSARGKIRSIELQNKTLLLIGYGGIGREVAKRAVCFGMHVIVYDPYLASTAPSAISIVSSLEYGLRQANVVSLHIPLTDETRNILGKDELSLLPKGAIVINASRGGLLDETSLLEAVSSGHLHGAGLDTFSTEPVPASSPLLAEKRIVLSPHSAALTEDALIAMGIKTVENVLAGLDGNLNADLVINKQILQ